ncbi:hypothetical protein QUA25_26500 [Microcoleus sp. Pol17C6]
MNTLKGDRLPGISVVISQVLPGWVEHLRWIFFDLRDSSKLRVLNLQKPRLNRSQPLWLPVVST